MRSITEAAVIRSGRCPSRLSSAVLPSPLRSATPGSGPAIPRPANAACRADGGLTMINGLADHVKTVRTAQGTRITLTFEHSVALEASMAERA